MGKMVLDVGDKAETSGNIAKGSHENDQNGRSLRQAHNPGLRTLSSCLKKLRYPVPKLSIVNLILVSKLADSRVGMGALRVKH